MERNYCERCNILTDEHVCTKCGNATREPQAGDLVQVRGEYDSLAASMFCDAMKNNGIEFVPVPVFEGMSLYNTPHHYLFCVRYADLERALDIIGTIWSGRRADEGIIDSLVEVTVDRPIGSKHPRHPDLVYKLNCGYVKGVKGGDGEWQDAYILDMPFPVEIYTGYVVAIIHRKNDVETKWVVAAPGQTYTKEQIAEAVEFQEKFFDTEIEM